MDLFSQKINSSPFEFSKAIKAKGPIFFSPLEQFWVVSDYDLAVTVLKSGDFSADRSAFFMSKASGCPFHKVANFFGVVKKMMVTSDPPDHTQRRRLASSGMNDQILDQFVPNVKSVVGNLLDQIKDQTNIEFVEQIALPLPNIILADLFSIPPENRRDFYRWSNYMTQFFGGGSSEIIRDAENADDGALQLSQYFTKLMKERKQNLQNDFISNLLRAQGSLDDSELISQAAIMLVAGTVTTTDQICNNLFSLLKSGIYQKLVQDQNLLDQAIEEATRLDPSVNFIFRVAKVDSVLAGVEIKAGQMVFISNHAVNRSEKMFSKPDDFVLDREKNPHLSYGSGIHYCLGARLARIQMRELFGQLILRYPNLSLDSKSNPIKKHQSLAFSGYETLPLQLINSKEQI